MGLERTGSAHFSSRPQEAGKVREARGNLNGETYHRELKLREFAPPASFDKLDKHEREAFPYLVRAVRRWAEIYRIQEGPDERAHFYPPRVKESEVRRAAEDKPELLSPYTVVLRDQDGSLTTVPMHQAYSKIIEATDIKSLLDNAAKKTRDKKTAEFLRAKSKALRDGNWELADRLWLEREDESDLDIVIGFYDTYTDKFMGIKYAAEAWAGVINREATEESQTFIDAFLDYSAKELGLPRPRVKIRVDETRVMSGQAAREDLRWTANSLPCQIDWRKKYGSKFTVFEPQFEDLLEARTRAFDTYIHPGRRSGIPKSLFRTGILRRYEGHEIGHSLVPEGIENRIGANKNWFNEYLCDVMSLDGYLNIPQVYTHNREHEVAFGAHFANGFLLNEQYARSGVMSVYFQSHAMILKSSIESGAVQMLDGKLTWAEIPEVRRTFQQLTQEAVAMAKSATGEELEALREKRLDPDIYQKIIHQS